MSYLPHTRTLLWWECWAEASPPEKEGCSMKEKAFPQWAADAVRWTKEHSQRALGLGLAALGCVLAALARTGGGDPFQDFALGLLMGLGVGCMAVGAVFLALSLRYQP